MTAETFAKQFLAALEDHLEGDIAQNAITTAATGNPGKLSRVFNRMPISLSEEEREALLNAKNEGVGIFSQTISEQIEPIVKHIFSGKEPTFFNTLYEKHFKGTEVTQEIAKEQIIQALFLQYGESTAECMQQKGDTLPLQTDISSRIAQVSAYFKTPEDVKKSAHPTSNNLGPIATHLEALKEANERGIFVLVSKNLNNLTNTILLNKVLIRNLKTKNKAIITLTNLLSELQAAIDTHEFNPDNMEEMLPELKEALLKIREEITKIPSKKLPRDIRDMQAGIAKDLKAIEVDCNEALLNLKTSIQHLEHAKTLFLNIKLDANFGLLLLAIDKQREALEEMLEQSLLKESDPLIFHTNTAINTLTELKRTLEEEENNILSGEMAETIPSLAKKVGVLKDVLTQTYQDILTESKQEMKQPEKEPHKILILLEQVLKVLGELIAWCGYVNEGTAKRRANRFEGMLEKIVYGSTAASTQLEKKLSESELQAKNRLAALPTEEEMSTLKLHNTHSPTILTNPPNSKAKNLVSDFQRALKNNELSVNGKPLSEYAADFHDFDTESDVLEFLQEVILKDVSGDKVPMLLYLKEKFHQNGLLYPVTSSMQRAMVEYTEAGEYCFAAPQGTTLTKKTNIVSNATGFTIQEHMELGSLLVYPNHLEKNNENSLFALSEDKITLSAETDGVPILEAQGTVQIDFSQNPAAPSLTAIENTITYGHPALALKMEKAHQSTLTKHPSSDGLSDADTEIDDWSPPSPTNTPNSGSSTPTAF